MDLAAIFLLIAVIVFLLAAFGVASSRVNLVALGLAFVALAMLLGTAII